MRWDLDESAFDRVKAVDRLEMAFSKRSSTYLIDFVEVKTGLDILISDFSSKFTTESL